MPITLDTSLPRELYPLAWLVGTWSGQGAGQVPGDDGEDSPTGRLIEQEILAEPGEDASLNWTMRTWVLDAPAPVPPTAAFADAEADTDAAGADHGADEEPAQGAPERRLLIEETGQWRVLGPVPGQDLEAAERAKPGTPEALVSYALEAVLTPTAGQPMVYRGEVRGPRIQLATENLGSSFTPRQDGAEVRAARMFGLVQGRLFWVDERATGAEELAPFLSAELDRHE